MIIEKIKEYLKNIDSIGVLSLIRWGLLALSIFCVILCEVVPPSAALAIFAILLWVLLIAFIVLSIIVFFKRKKAKKNKSY